MLDQLSQGLKDHARVAGPLLALVTFLIYSGALTNGFFLDDVPFILQNPFILNPHLWQRIFTGSIWAFVGAQTNYYRPLQFSSYWLVYRLAGADPAAFHLFQLVLYAATVWLVYRLGRELLQNELAAFAGALLWALHPLHVEAVAWIAALPEVGFTFFYVLAFLLFQRAEKNPGGGLAGHGLAALAYFPALFFKEMAVSFPLLIVAYGFFLGGVAAPRGWLERAVRWAPYFVAVGACAVVRRVALGQWIGAKQLGRVSMSDVGAGVALLGQHTRLFFWPASLSFFRTFDLGASLRSPWPWLALAGVVVAFWFRKREPMFAFLAAWWVITLLPSLDIPQLSIPLLADRFSYLPSQGLCLAIAYALLVILPRRLSGSRYIGFVLAAIAMMSVLWALKTVRTIPHWRDNQSMLTHELAQSPNAALLHFNRAVVLQYQYGDLDGAVREYEIALRMNRARSIPQAGLDFQYYLGLGQILYQKGRTEEAVSYFEKAVRASTENSRAYDALGSIYFPRRDYVKAADYFEQAIGSNPYDLGARFYLAMCWMKLRKYHEAAEQFRAARTIDPTYWQAYEAEAQALESGGDAAGAAQVRSLIREK